MVKVGFFRLEVCSGSVNNEYDLGDELEVQRRRGATKLGDFIQLPPDQASYGRGRSTSFAVSVR